MEVGTFHPFTLENEAVPVIAERPHEYVDGIHSCKILD